jgi:integrase
MSKTTPASDQRKERGHFRRAGQLVPRGDRTWLIRIFLGRDGAGRRRYLNKTVHGTKKDAQAELNSLLTQSDRGEVVQPSRETLDAFLDRWLRDVAAVKVRGNTLDQYDQTLRLYVRPALGRIRVCDLQLSDFNRLYRSMEGRGLSGRTVRLTHAVVCGAIEHAVENERSISRNPARRAQLPRVKKTPIAALTPPQVSSLRAAASKNSDGIVFLFAVATGMRPSEYLALRWADIDLEVCTAVVRRTIHRVRRKSAGTSAPDGPLWRIEEPKTESSRRVVKFSPSIAKFLKTHKASQAKARLAAGTAWGDNDLVFCTEIGTPIDGQNLKRRAYRPILAAAGLPESTRLYDLRHTMATLLIDEGVDARTVADRLGHSSVIMTLGTYTHPTSAMQERAASHLEEILFARPRGGKKR